MDLVLETLDTYVFDKLYSTIAPVSLAGSGSAAARVWSNSTALQETLQLLNSKARVNPDVYGYTPYLFDYTADTFGSLLPRYNLIRQFASLTLIVTFFGLALYLGSATLSYLFVFDRNIFNHPRYLKDQLKLEVKLATSAIPVMSMLTVPWFMLELSGYSQLHMNIDFSKREAIKTCIIEFCSFIFFTDFGVYLAHRWLHWPSVYKALHKPHHKWLVCTPFASHAFHPVDGYFQSLSYHIYPMLLPLHKVSYLILFVFVNFWTIMIHDGNHMSNNPVVNGTACHTVHHLYFSYNFGQFTTLWDRIGGTYRKPEDALFDPNATKDKAVMEEQLREVERYIHEVEGDDNDRVYNESSKKVN